MKKLCYILLCGLLTLLASCEKDTMAGIFAPEVTTGTATNIYRKGATLSGSIRFSEGMRRCRGRWSRPYPREASSW